MGPWSSGCRMIASALEASAGGDYFFQRLSWCGGGGLMLGGWWVLMGLEGCGIVGFLVREELQRR